MIKQSSNNIYKRYNENKSKSKTEYVYVGMHIVHVCMSIVLFVCLLEHICGHFDNAVHLYYNATIKFFEDPERPL